MSEANESSLLPYTQPEEVLIHREVLTVIESASKKEGTSLAIKLSKVELADVDYKALFHFLAQRLDGEKAYLKIHSTKNEVLHELIKKNEKMPELAKLINFVLTDSAQHKVMRDYAAQFVPDIYQRLKSEELRENLKKSLLMIHIYIFE